MTYVSFPLRYRLLRFIILFLFLYSMYPWVTWNLDFRIVWGITIPILAYVYNGQRSLFERKSKKRIAIFTLFALIIWIQKNTLMSMLFGVGLCWCVYVFLQLKLEYKQDIVRYITKYFAVLLAISLFVFIWSKVGFPFPHQVISFNDSSAYDIFLNYYFYVQPESMRDGFRFCSIFLEPGHMVMGLAPLLFINRYNIKSIPVFILFLALLASFSLAGYIVTAIGFLWDSFLRGKVKNAIMVTLVFALFLYLVTTFYANDLFDSLILARLQIVDGKLSGNDRMNSYFAAVFEAYVKSPDFMFGKGEFDAEKFHYGHGNSGWQVFAYIYGLVGLILCIIAYLAPAFTHKKKWSLWGFSAILLLLLMGNGYPTWWCMLIHLTIGAYTLTEPSRQS